VTEGNGESRMCATGAVADVLQCVMKRVPKRCAKSAVMFTEHSINFVVVCSSTLCKLCGGVRGYFGAWILARPHQVQTQ